ncbi:MAG: MarR family transcriptional regulator [Candidatus Methanoplasma sp.]|jgi:DNA-binding MarR family transcriptional regulator|nr:MarR family transcriptional regulator [Candidatus Methanoplasma sp.]
MGHDCSSPWRRCAIESFDMNPKQFKSFFSKFVTERVGETGLTESQIVFLTILDKKKGMSLKEMTEKVGVNKSLTTRAVKHLVENGFVINIAGSGKEYSVVLTEKGNGARKTAENAFYELFSLIFEDFTDEELVQMKCLLVKIKHRMEELSSKCQTSA